MKILVHEEWHDGPDWGALIYQTDDNPPKYELYTTSSMGEIYSGLYNNAEDAFIEIKSWT